MTDHGEYVGLGMVCLVSGTAIGLVAWAIIWYGSKFVWSNRMIVSKVVAGVVVFVAICYCLGYAVERGKSSKYQ